MPDWHIHHRSACRLCGAASPRRFLHFANMPLTDDFVTAARRGQEFRADLDIYFCPACGAAQTLHDVDVGDYYRDYRYTVSASPLARRFMQRLAEETFRRFQLRPGARVLEIGSGDGHQLACFRDCGARVLGFEPSRDLVAASRAAGVDALQCLFGAETVARIPSDMRPAQVVLLTYTFDHLPDPPGFLEAVRPVLDPERGVLLIEVHDLAKIVARCETCLFEHEHTIYLHEPSMERALERSGFKLLTADLLPEKERRGNSLLVAAGLRAGEHDALTLPRPLPGREGSSPRDPLDDWATYERFGQRVEQAHAGLRAYVRKQLAQGRRVAGYGAGGRGVMTLAMAGLTAGDVVFLCDRNASFHGLYTPATHVPVVPPERLLAEPIDEVIVFSYGYMDEIRAELREFEARGGRFTSVLDLLSCGPS